MEFRGHKLSRSLRVGIGSFAILAGTVVGAAEESRPVVKVVSGGESKTAPQACLKTVIAKGQNEPEAYPGYAGFVGWVSPIRLKSGKLLIGFSAGYWHASPPTPLRYSKNTIDQYVKMGLPADVVSPTGGRAFIVHSNDNGNSWSRPETLLETPDDDRHPAFVETPEGAIVCSVFTYPGGEFGDFAQHPEWANRVGIIRSFDQGKSWEKEVIRLPSPFLADETDGPLVILKDGSILLTISGTLKTGGKAQAAVFTSRDQGKTWTHLSTIQADHDLDEANATQLSDGKLVLMARPEGDIAWSADEGHTWTKPVTFGMRIYAPSLYTLRDGTLVCLHGSYAPKFSGLRAIFSRDGGHTWIAPAADHGFLVDDCYGYGKATELPDGSLLIADQGTGGHTTADAKSMSIRLLRMRIRPDYSGIELLPAVSN